MNNFDAPDKIRWLFLDLNSYFASVEQQINPDLRGKPVAVVPLETDATCAIAASYEAKAYGIKTGTKIYDAKQLCPDLICVLADHSHYVEFHHRILAEIDRHIPVTYIASIDEVACQLDKSQQNLESAIALALRIKQGIRQNVGEAIGCSIGLAPNRFLAKIATDMQKPNGLVVIEPKDIPQKLYSITFNDVPGIGKNMQKRLAYNGIHTVEQLYTIPPKQMRAIWHSVGGERMYYLLRGYELETYATQKRNVGHSNMLAPENRPLPYAHQVAARLLLKAASRLRRMEYKATSLDVSIHIERGARFAHEVRFEASCDNAYLLKQFQRCWTILTQKLNADYTRLRKVSINLHGLTNEETQQGDLFAQPESSKQNTIQRDAKLSAVVDSLNQKFGRNTVTMASTLGDANKVTGTKIAFARIPDMAEFKE